MQAGITQATWSNYETGKRALTVSSALRIAAVLDITLAELIDTGDAVILLRDSRLARALDEAAQLLDSRRPG